MSLNAPLEVMMYADEKARMLDILTNELPEHAVIVEYGCGGSTMMFADHLLPHRQLFSIEHNREWYEKVQAAVNVHPAKDNINLMYYRPDFPADMYQFSHPHEETPAGLERYLNPAIAWEDVYLVLVDGIARGACLAMLSKRLLTGARVILHDYKGRERWYDWILGPDFYTVERQTNMLLELR